MRAIGLALLSAASQLSSQSAGDARRWSGTAQLNGSVLFGETEQRAVGTRTSLSRADSVLEFSGSLQTLYGEASLIDEPRRVVKRLWLASLTADWQPEARWSPFALATIESSLEKRLARRYNTGVGVKYSVLRGDDRDVSVSLALLDERVTPDSAGAVSSRLTRWSSRLRIRRNFNERTRFSHITFWRPSATAIDRFVVQSNTEIAVGLSRRTALTVSFLDNYDSEAVSRGARRYNDGQLLLGLTANW